MTMSDEQEAIKELYRRAQDVLGPEAWDSLVSLVSARQRGQAFSTALRGAIKAMDGPDKVTDEQILGAFEIANEVWPVELEVMARAFYRQTDEP